MSKRKLKIFFMIAMNKLSLECVIIGFVVVMTTKLEDLFKKGEIENLSVPKMIYYLKKIEDGLVELLSLMFSKIFIRDKYNSNFIIIRQCLLLRFQTISICRLLLEYC